MLSLARGKEGTFKLVSGYQPEGDQPAAIEALAANLRDALPHQVLLGVTGSGKTFTMANVVARVNRPTLVIAPNKTLAAQLYNEFKSLFPDNAVHYFVSYYDYYQPEAYVPSTDTYIEKDSSINDEIDKLRHSATKALLERNDVLIVASVSCIYGLGEPEVYFEMLVFVEEGQTVERDRVLRKLVDIQYQRNDFDFHRGTFRVRGDTVEVFPAYEENRAVRIEFFGDEVEALYEIDPLRGKVIRKLRSVAIYPGLALRHHRGPDGDRGQEHPRRARAAARAAAPRQQAARSAAPGAAHALRPGDAGRDGLLPGNRELLAPPDRPRAGRAAADAARLLPEELPAVRRRIPRRPSRRSAGCTAATARASRRWSSSASGCRRRSTTGR